MTSPADREPRQSVWRHEPGTPETVTIRREGEGVALACSVCGAELRAEQQPIEAMLNAVETFVGTHTDCQGGPS
jgi:hypothetical protein